MKVIKNLFFVVFFNNLVTRMPDQPELYEKEQFFL